MSNPIVTRRLRNIMAISASALLAVVVVMATKDSAETGVKEISFVSPVSGKPVESIDVTSERVMKMRIMDGGTCVGVVFTDNSYDGDCTEAPKDLPTIAYIEMFPPARIPLD